MKTLTLTGNPISTQNLYLQRGHVRFMRQEAKDRKEQYQWEAKSQWRRMPLTEELAIEIRLFFGDKRRRDFDNFHKISIDALTGIVWLDDSQVKQATIFLEYDKDNPRTEISIL